jgi:hypothetical protein
VTHPTRYILRALLLAVLTTLLVGVGPALASSAKRKHPAPCWKTLINDWYDGRIDGTYPIHCYREALRHLPTDVDTYSSARDDIKQALQERIAQGHTKRKGDGGGGAVSGHTDASGGSGKDAGGAGPSRNGSGPGAGGGGKTASSGSGGGGGRSSSSKSPIKNVFDATKPGSADSVPVPLIVLAGVAVLLMAAGGIGFLARRARTRKLQLASLPQASPETPRSGS